MPLPQAQPRQKNHTRTVSCEAYLRDDGLWDIDAHMVDRKMQAVNDFERGRLVAEAEFHDMSLRMTIDEYFKVHYVEAAMDATPFGICPSIVHNFKSLEGTQIKGGWIAECRALVGGVQGCTHLNDLLPIIATTAFQALWPFKNKEALILGLNKVQDTCHAWSKDGEVVEKILADVEYYRAHQG